MSYSQCKSLPPFIHSIHNRQLCLQALRIVADVAFLTCVSICFPLGAVGEVVYVLGPREDKGSSFLTIYVLLSTSPWVVTAQVR